MLGTGIDWNNLGAARHLLTGEQLYNVAAPAIERVTTLCQKMVALVDRSNARNRAGLTPRARARPLLRRAGVSALVAA